MKVTSKVGFSSKINGNKYLAGTSADVSFEKDKNGKHILRAVFADGSEIKTYKFTVFFTPPTLKTLEKWSDEGIAKSVTGKKVEPDGEGPDGSPSWLLVLGMI